MPQLSEVLSGILRDVTKVRLEADKASAELVEIYRKDPVLQCFPVPRVEIRDLNIQLKFAFMGGEANEIAVDAKTLQELRDAVVSVLNLTTGIRNYDLLTPGAGSEGGKILVESDK